MPDQSTTTTNVKPLRNGRSWMRKPMAELTPEQVAEKRQYNRRYYEKHREELVRANVEAKRRRRWAAVKEELIECPRQPSANATLAKLLRDGKLDDAVRRFLQERCDTSDRTGALKVRSSDAFRAFGEWCTDRYYSQKEFNAAMAKNGFAIKRSNGSWFIGITVKESKACNVINSMMM